MVRAVINFFRARHVSVAEVHSHLLDILGEKFTRCQSVVKRCSDSQIWSSWDNGWQKWQTNNSKHPPRTKHILKQQSWITEEWLWMSFSMVWVLWIGQYSVLFRSSASTKFCAMDSVSTLWRPQSTGMVSAISFLQQYAIYGYDYLECNVAGDETWVHHYSPGKKTCKHGVEISCVPVIEKIQDGHICW